MSLSDRFISRPVLTSVCSLVIFILGLISLGRLPIDFLPNIAQPQIVVTAIYPGGNASFVELSITQQLEDILSDTPGVDYITSTSKAGSTSITLYLEPDTSADTASLDVQNRVQQAKSTLPQVTQDEGITISQTTDTSIGAYLITSTKGQYDAAYLNSIAKDQLQKQLQLIDGVGKLTLYPPKPVFQISIDPNLVRAYGLSIDEVDNQIFSQNFPASGGFVGASRVGDPSTYSYSVMIEDSGFIQSIGEFEDIVLKRLNSGAVLRVKDIGQVQYIASPESAILSSSGYPGVFIDISLQSGSNAVEVGEQIDQLIQKFKSTAPPGIKVVQFNDRKTFILDSISNVFDALGLAIILVVLILLLFLQNWRTILIPGLAIPISIVGTFAFLQLFDYTLNFLTMTALVLATGLVVDDAILVVQSVTANIQKGMNSTEAAFASMNELFGAIISTSLVLISLFLPVTLVSGPIGNIYIQFAVTIICSIAISTFNALTFSPMMSALLLRPGRMESMPSWTTAIFGAGVGLLMGYFTKASFGNLALPISAALFAVIGLKLETVFNGFDQIYSKLESAYEKLLGWFLKKRKLVCVSLVPLAFATLYLFNIIPAGFIPQEDMNLLTGAYLLNPGASITAYEPVSSQTRNFLNREKEKKSSGIKDFVIIDTNQGYSPFFIQLLPLGQRRQANQKIEKISSNLSAALAALPTRYPPQIFQLPMIPGFGQDASLTVALTDESSGRYSIDEFYALTQQFLAKASQEPSIQSIQTQFSPDNPSYQINIDRSLLGSLNLSYKDVVNTIGTYAGSKRIVQTSLDGGPKDVVVISQSQERSTIDQLMNYGIKNSKGDYVAVKEIASYELVTTPMAIDHFNFNRSIEYKAVPNSGYSTGDVIKAVKNVVASLGFKDIGYQFTGVSRVQEKSGGQIVFLFVMAALTVFLVLSAQYESYIISTVIMITVPIAILGSLVFLQARSMNVNIFVQIGLLMLIGLAAKNSILIVEAAEQRVSAGAEIVFAAVEAGKARLQPILMTSVASLAGFFPLVIAQNAGASAQQAIGTVVFGGLLMGMTLSLLVVPPVYVLIKNLETRLFSRNGNASVS
ncbi:RND multidrug efflux transporter/ MMPL family [Synechococcus sp. BIOS-E4-1]|uniref:efflux RND transporter permease subunit n=1 Tax=Synechococcus sp. BIOS-E4-1 TaxID=1400864 RepID=UPI001644E0E1|nr:efflux RND transporter permease subunit [Synechococcus sp. BIOS-E4-1]QNI56463.1 RND multidrug efflux transporter/ MMPL family [Synechococcus sp. BIOS-E4-1]